MKIPKRYETASWDGVSDSVKEKIEKIRESRRGLYIHGEVGTGKTHMAYGIYKHLKEDMKLNAWFLNTIELMFDIKRDFDRSNYDKVRWDEKLQEYRGVLILDDIGAEKITDFVLETFYLIINSRYNEMLPTIFTSNMQIGELADRIGDRTASRIVEMCDIVHLSGADRRILRANTIKNG